MTATLRKTGRFSNFSLEEYNLQKRAITRGAVVRFSRGNIALQHGDYVTREELDQRLTELARDLGLHL